MAGTSMRRTVRRALALTLSFAMVWGGVPVPALAQMANEVIVEEEPTSGGEVVPQEGTSQTPVEQGEVKEDGELVAELPDIVLDTVTSPNAEENNDELLDAYVQQMLDEAIPGATSTRTFGAKNAGDKLEGANATLYQAFKDMAIQASKGKIDTTKVTIACKDLQSDYNFGPWTAADLEVTTLVDGNALTPDASAAVWARIPISLARVVSSLLADCPYDLFWYDKTAGILPSISGIHPYEDASGTVTKIDLSDAQITFYMYVSANYSSSGSQETTTIDKDRIADINGVVAGAVNRAQSIVTANSGKDTLERLKAYKKAICDLVSYNDDAAISTSIPYGDPWQLIWVFDDKVENNQGNPETKVVCEGYSKAFKYLCDLTWPDPATGIECILVSGTMDVSGGEDGAHMWNIVHMDDGNNYLVDVTNCDTGTVGYPEQLFMRYNENNEASNGSFEGGYTFKPQDYSKRTVTYKYGNATTSTFSKDELTLSTIAYKPSVTLVSIEGATVTAADQTYAGTELTPEPTVRVGNKTLQNGTDYTCTYQNNRDAGTATVTVTGKGNYTGSASAKFRIKPATITAVSVSQASYTYDGTQKRPGVTVKTGSRTVPASGYTVSYANNTNAGTATVTVTGKGNYTGSKSTTFRINAAAITSVSLSQTSFTYDGGAKRPGVTVKAGSRTVPASGYNVSYANNVSMGTATVTVSGKGNYTGSRSATFRIVAPPEPEPAPEPTPHVSYRTHVQRIGWQGYVSDGAMSGTSGRSFRLEGINIYLSDLPCGGGIEYRTHVQRIGWQGWRRDNAMAGTKGKSYRLEAIEIKLYGEMADRYDVYYRVHCQKFGWMGWASNGQRSGSAGYSRRLEGIQIVLVPKGQPGPGPTLNGITQRFSAPFKQKGKK
ncbi:MAG: hypothetical protein Q4A01_11045 [Coriobacteriales bacterium]|nr:hypothetical protein [Coriobacteriales bacterium]